jgi:transcriptional regulator with XRE-family HTH domain
MTLIEAAEQTGVGRDTLSDLERGRRHPVLPTLAKIAQGYGVPVEDLLEEPVAAGKTVAPPSSEQPPLNNFGEEQRPEVVPGWVTVWLRPDWQRAGEALDEICRKWTELEQSGELDHDAIERFFEEAERWTPVVEPALIAEARQLILTGQVPLDPNIDPNNLLSPEFLGLLDRLFRTGKLGSAWSRWMDLQNEFLAQAEEQAEDLKIDPKMLERIKNVAEESRVRSPLLNALGRGRTGAA